MRPVSRVETITAVGDEYKFSSEFDKTINALNECGATYDITFSTNSETVNGIETATRYTAFISVYKEETK
ncbi:hypothetical protein COD17_08585 [Bacillus thuringiensis]|nr:hypothetical protein COD17_08585 [Bacillus thuringiensis]